MTASLPALLSVLRYSESALSVTNWCCARRSFTRDWALRSSTTRHYQRMSYTTDRASPFTGAVVRAMRKLYPEELADSSFDNTGLLLEAPFDPIRRQMNSVLLTVDLTKAVADEAVERKDCVVVAYHPIIFKGFKSLTLADAQQQSLLRLALEGISVYSPHTAVDAVSGGLGDWLADIVTGTLPQPEPQTHTAGKQGENGTVPALNEDEIRQKSQEDAKPKQKRPGMPQRASTYSKPTYPQSTNPEQLSELNPSELEHTRSIIRPTAATLDDFGETGYGRLVQYKEPQPLTALIERIAHGVGSPKGFPVAIPQNTQVEDIMISSVGVCAGSGHDVLRDCDANLLFTGELSHHDALRITEQGKCVISLFHSNTERGFLSTVMKDKLTEALKEEWAVVREEMREELRQGEVTSGEVEAWQDALEDEDVLVEVSQRDRDPYGMVILQSDQEGMPLR